ncbi:MAG: hypothetical protein COV66_08700 [Nitrospinae bacterium CG11_big_fil_rev_8_21_14_0_20_45_15]|nr:MAG: hypothetical protein COV66_08700 [Nitrospinae bacterium CG11_big_fil_rev_8_21_14_0_20_45_15]
MNSYNTFKNSLLRKLGMVLCGILIVTACTNDLFESGNPLAPSTVMRITPTSTTINEQTTQQFTIIGGVSPFNYTVDDPASGSIDTAGLFTAANIAADATVTVTVVDAEGTVVTAAVNVKFLA